MNKEVKKDRFNRRQMRDEKQRFQTKSDTKRFRLIYRYDDGVEVSKTVSGADAESVKLTLKEWRPKAILVSCTEIFTAR
jgi:hypothetical protein